MNDRRTALIGLAAIGAIALLRASVLYSPGAPSGIDGGNWLAFGTFERFGMVYPPVVPWAFAALVAVVGAPIATAMSGAAATAAPALAILGVLIWARRPAAGAVAAVTVVASRPIGEMAAWGGYPEAIGTAAALLALVALAACLRGGSRVALGAFAVSLAAVVGTSHLVAVPTAGAIALMLCGEAIRSRRRAVRRVTAAAAFTVLPFALLAPTYLALFATLGGSDGGMQPGDAGRVLGVGWPLYVALLVLLPLGLGLSRWRTSVAAAFSSRDLVLLAAASAAAVTWVLAYLVSGEPRLLGEMEVLALFGIAAFVPLARSVVGKGGGRLAVGAGALAVVGLLVATGLSVFPDQVAFYRILTSDRFTAIEWLARNAPAQDRSILVADLSGVSVGWWTEGMVGREVLFAADLHWLRFTTERDRAKLANALLYRSGFPGGNSLATIRQAGVRYVFLPSAGAFGVDPMHPPSGWQVAFAIGDVVVLAPTA
ncbi:MAG: hypothetical protein P4L84_10750 [Isosphaeraceae bacterium]|nr:hypothetical protein [Isosphaeraceae bacterium]